MRGEPELSVVVVCVVVAVCGWLAQPARVSTTRARKQRKRELGFFMWWSLATDMPPAFHEGSAEVGGTSGVSELRQQCADFGNGKRNST